MNESTENIGARRLHTVMEKLLEELSYSAGEEGQLENQGLGICIDASYVNDHLQDLAANEDLSRYIL